MRQFSLITFTAQPLTRRNPCRRVHLGAGWQLPLVDASNLPSKSKRTIPRAFSMYSRMGDSSSSNNPYHLDPVQQKSLRRPQSRAHSMVNGVSEPHTIFLGEDQGEGQYGHDVLGIQHVLEEAQQ